MQLSLVIYTRNRALQLAECLRSLTRLRYSAPWELVIADNGSKDETQDVISSYTESLPLKTVIEPSTGTWKGSASQDVTQHGVVFGDFTWDTDELTNHERPVSYANAKQYVSD